MSKQMTEKQYMLKLNLIWALVIITLASLIGLFWGTDGYRITGIVIACVVGLGLLFAMLK